MAVTAQGGIFSFGPQSARDVAPTTYYRHRGVNINLGVNDDTRLGRLEVGGIPVPTFPYKTGYMVGGGAMLQPRLEDTFGWLLYGGLGKLTSSTGVVGQTGAYDHLFEMTADGVTVPWMGARKYIPPKDGDLCTDLGEVYTNLKVLGLAFQMASSEPLTSRVDFLGIDFSLDDSPDGWSYGNTFEDWDSIPVACQTDGYIDVDGDELPVMQATVAWQNNPLPPDQEKVIGSPMLDDVTIISRQLSFDLMVKYESPALYRRVLTGNPLGTTWSGTPFTVPVEVNMVSSVNMPSLTAPYALKVYAPEVNLQLAGALPLAAEQAVMLRFQGVALANAGSYAQFTLRNKKTTYTWPT